MYAGERRALFRREDDAANYWPAVVDVFIGFLAVLLISALLAYSELTSGQGTGTGFVPPRAKESLARELAEAFARVSGGGGESPSHQPRIEDLGFSELKIYFPASFLFAPCHTELKEPAVAELTNLRRIFHRFDADLERVQITGHTDTDRPSPSGYCRRQGIRSNWELSARRAISVLELLSPDDRTGLDPQKVWGAALGEYHPVDRADTREAKSRNRRIEILIRFRE